MLLSGDCGGVVVIRLQPVCCCQETVEVLLSYPGLKDEQDLEGRTAFLWAAAQGAEDVIATFNRFTVDLQQTDKTGGTGT